MIMPDGEILPLPADSSGLTMFPEIGQEKHWAKASYPLEIEELCELLMSRERVRRLRKDMPDPASDSVLPTTNDPSAAVQQMPSSEVVGSLTEANAKPIVAPGAEAQVQESEVPPDRQSGRLQCYPRFKNLGLGCKSLELCADVESDVGIKAKSRLLGFL